MNPRAKNQKRVLPRDSSSGAAAKQEKLSKEEHRRKLIQDFLDLMSGKGENEFFHTPKNEPFARVEVNGHFENWPIRSRGFELLVRHLFYKAFSGASLPPAVLKEILLQLEGHALFGGKEHRVALRVAEHRGKVYLDLCDPDWRAVEITPAGWSIVANPPVYFIRKPGMLELPEPVHGGNVEELFRFVNAKTRSQRILMLSWLFATFRPTGPYPIYVLHGPQGSAKTTTETVLRRLIDPSEAELRAAPRDERDLMIAAEHSHVIGFDNFSAVSSWLSDALCRLSTGSGFATRQLYKDRQQVIFSATRPILLNGIHDVAERGDLLDRIIVIYLSPIDEGERRPERQLWAEFEEARPRVIGAMLDAVAAALRQVDSVRLTKLPRMADFAIWVTAGEEALGFWPGEFLRTYEDNRAEANLLAIESSPVAVEVLRMLNTMGEWQGTAGDLLVILNRLVGEDNKKDQQWPKSARAMAAALARSEPNLAAVGVTFVHLPREGGTGRRVFRLSRVTHEVLHPEIVTATKHSSAIACADL